MGSLALLSLMGCLKENQPATRTGQAQLSAELAELKKSMSPPKLEKPPNSIRFATFNISFHRTAKGELAEELSQACSQQAAQIAEIIQRTQPDVVLLNEFDYDSEGQGLKNFLTKYLHVSQNGQPPANFPYTFSGPVNTGVDSGLDLNADGFRGSPEDAFGYGVFPGQYGMAVLSRFPIDHKKVRTFQNFLWKDMPNAQWPVDPATAESYYSDEIKSKYRLSSKSHWDVPITINGASVHFLVSHPTPPVFDGSEDRNGCRNRDEIRFWADYVDGLEYFYDDNGNKGGLAPGCPFVVAGDLNADPIDGDSRKPAIELLLDHPKVASAITPFSLGGALQSKALPESNLNHSGRPEFDTSQFKTGNLRVDYCLPSSGKVCEKFNLLNAGVYWPLPGEEGNDLITATDHRLVWIDVEEP
jgi:3-phytase/alkaline phosphatase D